MIPVKDCYEEWKRAQFPGHLLYGITHLPKYGIEAIYHSIPFNPYKRRLRLSLYNLTKILFCKESFDAIYAATQNGLELLIFLRALGLFGKPIIIWHHSAIIIPENRFRRIFSKLFYKGIDKACFFSKILLDKSVETEKIQKENAFLIHWGADLAFYDTFRYQENRADYYVSAGQDCRDFGVLINAFNQTTEQCNIYLPVVYKKQIEQKNIIPNENIRLFFGNVKNIEIAQIINKAFAVAIPCMPSILTTGLTSLMEAMALGLPLITTDNPFYPIDVEKEKIGIKVPYGDAGAWIEAIRYLSAHPDKAKEMGANARQLAEKQYNLELFSKEIASILLQS
jgi:glycosyltransferase involved in cell wall biosynthesis